MDSQVIINTGEWKIKVILGLGGLATLIILAFLYRFEAGLILLTSGSIVAIRLVFWAKHKYTLGKLQERQLTAQTRQIELEADRQHWQVQQEKAIAAKLAREQYFIEQKAGTFVIGNFPFAFYPSASAAKQLAEPLALPAPSLDYFQVMSDPHQAYAIVGPQRIGKSVQAQRLAQHLAHKGYTCLVIGTKAQPGEWLNCKRFIGNEAVSTALARLLAEIKHRIENGINTPKLAIFLDDWLNTVALDPDLSEEFFLEAATRILTAGIVPYFLLQSDSKADWGTKHGAQLKNNFVHLLLNAPRENGRLNYNKLRAKIIYPGEKEQHFVNLPSGLPMLGDNEPNIELSPMPEIQPTNTEQQILAMHADGQSYRTITTEIWGQVGKFYNDKIDSVLAKYGEK